MASGSSGTTIQAEPPSSRLQEELSALGLQRAAFASKQEQAPRRGAPSRSRRRQRRPRWRGAPSEPSRPDPVTTSMRVGRMPMAVRTAARRRRARRRCGSTLRLQQSAGSGRSSSSPERALQAPRREPAVRRGETRPWPPRGPGPSARPRAAARPHRHHQHDRLLDCQFRRSNAKAAPGRSPTPVARVARAVALTVGGSAAGAPRGACDKAASAWRACCINVSVQ